VFSVAQRVEFDCVDCIESIGCVECVKCVQCIDCVECVESLGCGQCVKCFVLSVSLFLVLTVLTLSIVLNELRVY